jgi:hypothetical protein
MTGIKPKAIILAIHAMRHASRGCQDQLSELNPKVGWIDNQSIMNDLHMPMLLHVFVGALYLASLEHMGTKTGFHKGDLLGPTKAHPDFQFHTFFFSHECHVIHATKRSKASPMTWLVGSPSLQRSGLKSQRGFRIQRNPDLRRGRARRLIAP